MSSDLSLSADLSSDAYMSPEAMAVKRPGSVYIRCESSGFDAYVWAANGRRRSFLYIVFRGVHEIQDFLASIDVRQTHLDLGVPIDGDAGAVRVHAGVLRQYATMRAELMRAVEGCSHRVPPDEIICVGHSLGGALATLASVDMRKIFPGTVVRAHTFGSPRLGNRAFAKWYASVIHEHVRVAHMNDPVPRVPFSCHFEHVRGGTCIHLSGDGSEADVGEGGDTSWWARPFMATRATTIEAHLCQSYIDGVARVRSEWPGTSSA
jgi:pimeloyl-ACP methyl ester carboxylesterase